jgi:hypothetical protein
MNQYAVLRYHGTIYRVKKLPYETQEQVMDRLWYIIKQMNSENLTYEKAYNSSLQWVYNKYLKVKYA